jgi:hypothetical protein
MGCQKLRTGPQPRGSTRQQSHLEHQKGRRVARKDADLNRRPIRVIMKGLSIIVSMAPTSKIDRMANIDGYLSRQVVSTDVMLMVRREMNEDGNQWRRWLVQVE